MTRLFTLLGLLCLPLFAAAQPAPRAALFVADRTGDAAYAAALSAFNDQIAAALAKRGVAVVDKRDTAEALANYKKTADAPLNAVDAALENESSALALARALGVDCIVLASLTGADTDVREFNGYGVVTLNETHLLYATARILDIREGAALSGANVVASRTIPQRPNLKVSAANVAAPLLAEAADKLADAVGEQMRAHTEQIAAAKTPTSAGIEVACTWGDLTFPEIVKTKDGEYRTTQTRYPVALSGVAVELNGLTLGTAPAAISAPKGLAKLRLSREGFRPWERTVNITEGLKLNIALALDDAGLARWKDMAQFTQDLKAGAKLTDAQVRVLDGYAQTLRQSGMRIDQKQDVRVNTTDGIVQYYGQSWFPQIVPVQR